MLTTTVAEVITDELVSAGIDRVFGLPGGEVLHLIEALRSREISFELCRHEANAGVMAAVYGKLKRVPGVVLVTLGPGAANLMFPLANSLLDREPLVAISAQIPAEWPESHTHQRLPLLQSYVPVTKFATSLNPFTARKLTRQALEVSLDEPAGPSFLTLSAQDAVATSYESISSHHASLPLEIVQEDSKRVGGESPEAAAEEIWRQLADADRPLVLLGAGARPYLADKIRKWLETWELPVAVTPKIKGIVDETRENFVGVVGGMAIDNVMLEALKEADLLLGFGFDPVEVDKTWHANLPILWVLESPLALGVLPRERLIAVDHEAVLDCLLSKDKPRTWKDNFDQVRIHRRSLYMNTKNRGSDLRSNPIRIVSALAEILPPETIVTTDVGSHKYLFGQFWPSQQPETFFMSNGLSGMGYGLSSAIGAKLARPNAPVLAVLGDGGFSMNSQELETARRLGAPIIVVVLADNSLSLIRLGQKSRGLPRYGVDFEPIDSVLTARACGVEGRRAESVDELQQVVAEAVDSDHSLVVEVPVDVAAYHDII